ncbi:MAG: hypothetical protein R3D98_08085 [Candidatus Krumholzibacteriia bacterium]
MRALDPPAGRVAAGFGQQVGAHDEVADRQIVVARALDQAADGGVADLALGLVDDALQRDFVRRVGDELEVGQQVADLAPLVELDAADHLVGDARAAQRVLEQARLGVRAVEDRDLAALELALALPLHDLDHAGGLVLGVEVLLDRERLAAAGVGPEVLALAAPVVADDGVGRVEDVAERAVVLLEAEGASAGEVLVEIEHVLHAGAAPAVDRLVVVADGEHVAVHRAEELDEQQLQLVGVLELVDQHVAELARVLLAEVLLGLEQVDGLEDEVVEVDGLALAQALLVGGVDAGEGLVGVGGGGGRRLLRRLVVVLPGADRAADRRQSPLLDVEVEVLQDALQKALLVVGVVDGEVARQAEAVGVAAQDARAGGVEGADPEGSAVLAHGRGHPLLHLARGLVGEGVGQDLARVHALFQQPGDAGGEHARLAAAGAGDDEDGAVRGGDGLALGGIQGREEVGHGGPSPGAGERKARPVRQG